MSDPFLNSLQIVQWTINHYTVIGLKKTFNYWASFDGHFDLHFLMTSFLLDLFLFSRNCEWNCEADRKMSWKRNEFDGSFKQQQPPAAHSQSLLLWKILIISCTLLYCHNTIKVWIQSKEEEKDVIIMYSEKRHYCFCQ